MNDNQKPERTLSEAEIKRVELIKQREQGLFAEGYTRKDLTVSIEKANTLGLLITLPFAIAIVVLFLIFNGIHDTIYAVKNDYALWLIGCVIFLISCVVLALVHEGIHGLIWAMGSENHFKDIEFGFIKEKLTPYCTSKAPISKSLYILGALMPMTILGLGIGIASILTGNFIMMTIGAIQTLAGAGDFLITCLLLRHKSKGKKTIIIDHPTECGCIVYEK